MVDEMVLKWEDGREGNKTVWDAMVYKFWLIQYVKHNLI